MSRMQTLRRLLDRAHAADYLGIGILVLGYVWVQFLLVPFHQMFSIDDQKIQHPFATKERVPVGMMFIYGSAVPLVALIVALAVARSSADKFHVTILGLLSSLLLTSFVTDIIKNAVGRPRPDMLARCKPDPGLSDHGLVTIAVCTQDNLEFLNEGFRSFPSGHSSFSFSGLGYLALFLAGQLGVFRPRADLARVLLALAPALGALMIAMSRLEDYRHDYYDVCAGSLIGMIVAYSTYRRKYPALSSASCATPYVETSEDHANTSKSFDEEMGVPATDGAYERIPLQERH